MLRHMWGLHIMWLQKSGKTSHTTIKGMLLLECFRLLSLLDIKLNGKLQTMLTLNGVVIKHKLLLHYLPPIILWRSNQLHILCVLQWCVVPWLRSLRALHPSSSRMFSLHPLADREHCASVREFILFKLCVQFQAPSWKSLILKICRGAYPALPGHLPYELQYLIKQMFKINPKDRPSVHTILTSHRVSRLLHAHLPSLVNPSKFLQRT